LIKPRFIRPPGGMCGTADRAMAGFDQAAAPTSNCPQNRDWLTGRIVRAEGPPRGGSGRGPEVVPVARWRLPPGDSMDLGGDDDPAPGVFFPSRRDDIGHVRIVGVEPGLTRAKDREWARLHSTPHLVASTVLVHLEKDAT